MIKGFWRIEQFWTFKVMPFFRHVTGRRLTKGLLQFKDKHKDERCFIIASGPSLREDDILKLKKEITIGVNSVAMLCEKIDWVPTYYTIADGMAYDSLCDLLNKLRLKNVFMQINLYKQRHRMSFQPYWIDWQKDIYRDTDENNKKYIKFNSDIYKDGVYASRTITYTALQLAAFLGFKEIYLYGVDNSFNTKNKLHFQDDGYMNNDIAAISNQEYLDKNTHDNELFFEAAKNWGEKNDVKIFNATRGGKLEVFDRVNFDDIVS